MRHDASWMSNDDLLRAAEALFSFQSSNERDEAARLTLVRELAQRGIDPHTVGYKGGPVTLNPNPKKDPVAKAADDAQKKAQREIGAAQRKLDTASRTVAAEQKKAVTEKARQEKDAAAEADRQAAAAAEEKRQQALTEIGNDLASGKITEAEAREKAAALGK